jgi:lincosamide nucleotidyltransferase A/C/D/E
MNTTDYSQPKREEPDPTMEASAVLDLYNTLENLGVQVWVDGGWGVDALLEHQTRAHKDLDIAMQERDVPQFRQLLEGNG